MSSDTQAATSSVNYLTLTFAVFGGAAAWLLRLILNSSLVEWSCAIDATWPLWATTTVATLVAVAALVIALRYYRMTGDAPHHDAVRRRVIDQRRGQTAGQCVQHVFHRVRRLVAGQQDDDVRFDDLGRAHEIERDLHVGVTLVGVSRR